MANPLPGEDPENDSGNGRHGCVSRIYTLCKQTMNMNNFKHIFHQLLLASAILLAGCTGLQAPHMESTSSYQLEAKAAIPATQTKRNLVLAVSMPRARPGFDTQRMAYVRQPHELDYFATHQWVDTPSHMLAPLLTQALQQSAGFQAVVQSPGTVAADVRLDTELVRLQQDFGTQPSRVNLTLRVQLIDVRSKRVLASKQFDETENAPADNAYGGVIAANHALQRILEQLAEFCITASARP